MNIYQKLLQIQCKVNGLGKDSTGGQYRYVSGAKVLEFIRPMMNELGLLLKQEVLDIDNSRQDYFVNAKKWEACPDGRNVQVEYQKPKAEILSKVMMRFTWIDVETGEKDVSLFGANGQNDWEKGLGSALTYAERYFLLKFFHIPTDEDDIDNEARKKKPQQSQQPQQPQSRHNLAENDAEWKKIEAALKEGKTFKISSLKKRYEVSPQVEQILKTKLKLQ